MKYVEATIVIPVTILIVMSLISLTMTFWTDMEELIDEHQKCRIEVFEENNCW